MNNRLLLLVLFIATGIFAYRMFSGGASADALDYRGSWSEAVAEAAETGKPILLAFGGPW